jgi:hypothetical protein
MGNQSLFEASRSTLFFNVAENGSKNELIAAMRSRTLDTLNDLIYARIGRIRPLGHYGPPMHVLMNPVLTISDL